MREPEVCLKVRRRLAQHGLPAARIERIARELSEHWEDLRADALNSGATPAEAAAEANRRLGKPDALAANIVASLRRSSWFGRHPLVSVCILPLLLPPALMGAVVLPAYWITKIAGTIPWNQPDATDSELIVSGLWVVYYLTLTLSTVWLCWRSWQAGLGTRWIMAMCTWCALTALLRFFNADPLHRNVVMGFGFPWRLNNHTGAVLILHLLTAAWFLRAARWISGGAHAKTEEPDSLNRLAETNQ